MLISLHLYKFSKVEMPAFFKANHEQKLILTVLFKCLNISNCPVYLKMCLPYSLWGTNILSLPEQLSTAYDLHSYRYSATKAWDSLPGNLRILLNLH